MQEYKVEVQRTLIYIIFWAGFSCAGAAMAGCTAKVPGFLLGVAASIIYFLLMCYRVRRSAGLPAGKAVAYMRSGWLVRLAFVVFVLIISVKTPGVDFLAAVVGLFSLQIVTFFNAACIIAKWFFATKLNFARKG